MKKILLSIVLIFTILVSSSCNKKTTTKPKYEEEKIGIISPFANGKYIFKLRCKFVDGEDYPYADKYIVTDLKINDLKELLNEFHCIEIDNYITFVKEGCGFTIALLDEKDDGDYVYGILFHSCYVISEESYNDDTAYCVIPFPVISSIYMKINDKKSHYTLVSSKEIDYKYKDYLINYFTNLHSYYVVFENNVIKIKTSIGGIASSGDIDNSSLGIYIAEVVIKIDNTITIELNELVENYPFAF